jgi:hypothetical protein
LIKNTRLHHLNRVFYIAEIKKQRIYRELEQSKKRLLEENITQLYTHISQNPIETLKSGANISELLSRVWDLTFKGPDNDETRTAQRIIAEKISRIKTQGINRGTYADYAAQLFEIYYQSLRHKFATSNHHGHHQSHRYHHRHHIKHKGLRRAHFSVNRRVLCKTPRQIMAHQKRELIDRQKQSRLVIAQKKKVEAARQRQVQQVAAQKKKAEDARKRRAQQVVAQKKKVEAARQRQAQLVAAQKKKAEVARQRRAQLVAAQKKKVEDARKRRAQQVVAQKKEVEDARKRRAQQVAAQKKKEEVARQRQQARLAAAQKKKVKK